MPNEWTFTATVKSWMDAILRDRPDLPFGRVDVEQRGKATTKRRDITIFDRGGQRVLTGEIKMPDNPQGGSPYNNALVMDAHDKANREGVEHFFTWNVNRLVLWQTFERNVPITE